MPESVKTEVRFSFQSIREIDKITATLERRLLETCKKLAAGSNGSCVVEPEDVAQAWNELIGNFEKVKLDEQKKAA